MSFMGKLGLDPIFLFPGQPRGVCRSISEIYKQYEPEDHSRRRFEQEYQLPSGKAERAVEPENGGRDRAAQGYRNWGCDGKPGNHATAMARREPIMEIEENSWEKAGLSGAQQKPQNHKAGRAGNKGHRAGTQAPRNHDTGKPKSGADSLQYQVAGNFE